MNEVVDEFLRLVQIDSPSGFEQEMGDYIKAWLKKAGFGYREDKVGNILGFKASYSGKPILLGSHMDTVEPGRSIRPKVKDGVISSDGTTILGADNKASVAATIVAVNEYLADQGELPDVELLFSVKEETGGGAEFFPFDWIRSKRGYLFDYAKPLGRIVVAAPYIYNFKIVFSGKAAHASRPEEGANSLLPAARFITKFPVGKFDGGKTTINIGKLVSGTGINTIPEETIVEGEVRSTSKIFFDKHIELIKIVLKKALEGSQVKANLSFDGYCSGYEYSKSDPEVKNITKVLEELGLFGGYDRTTGISDANPLVGAGIKVLNLSDGVQDPHTKQEKITIEDLVKLKKVVLTILNKTTFLNS